MNKILNLKTAQSGFAHMFLLAVIIVVGVASYGAYRVVSSSASVNNNTVSVNTENGCWLAGRKWDNKKAGECLKECRNQGTEFNKNGTASGFCVGHVWIMDDAQRCTLKLHRLYIEQVNGCARKPNQADGKDQRFCQAGYPYYNADYSNRNEGNSGKVDICEASKQAAVRNENNGTPGQGSPSTPSSSTNGGSSPSPNTPSSGAGSGSSGSGSNSGSGNAGSGNNSPSETATKATIRVGAYNAWSYTHKNDKDQARRLQIGMSRMKANGAEIVAMQELSSSQTFSLNNSSYWDVYRSKMAGDRGLGVAYKRNDFKVISASDLVIPRAGADHREPVVTLERKRDKARITVMSVHLVSFTYGMNNYNQYQPRQQKAVRDKALSLKQQGHNVILAGDFNWDFKKRNGHMSPLKFQGIRYTNFFVPSDQKLSNFKDIDAGAASDHRLIFVDAEVKL